MPTEQQIPICGTEAKPRLYGLGDDPTKFTDAELVAALQHYHYVRCGKFRKKQADAKGKPYQPMLNSIGVWHEVMAALLKRIKIVVD